MVKWFWPLVSIFVAFAQCLPHFKSCVQLSFTLITTNPVRSLAPLFRAILVVRTRDTWNTRSSSEAEPRHGANTFSLQLARLEVN